MRTVNCSLNGPRDANEFAYKGPTTDFDPTEPLSELDVAERVQLIWAWSGYDGVHDAETEEWWWHTPSGTWSTYTRTRDNEDTTLPTDQ